MGNRCLGTREKRRIDQDGPVNSITQIGRGNNENDRDLGECMHLVSGGERRGVRVLRELDQNSGIMQKEAISGVTKNEAGNKENEGVLGECVNMEIGVRNKGIRGLREIDQNCESIQKVANSGINKNGVWIRQCGRHRALGRQLGGERLESGGNTKESK